MRILYISARQCWPPNSGGKLRDHRLLLALGQASDLTYIYYAEPGVQPVTPSDIPVCRRIVSVPRPARYRPGKIVRGLLGPWPLPVVNYTSPAMIDAIRSVLRQDRFDLVHLDSLHLAACEAAVRSELGRSAIIYGWHDVASELMWRYSQMPISLARRTYARFTARRLERAEAAILDTAFGHVVCSERERVSLLARSPKARIAVIENGVDTGAFKPPNRNSELTRIVFVGAMHYYANIDAVTWFARQIWPAMHQRFPRYRFTIVGADPKPEVRALGDLPDRSYGDGARRSSVLPGSLSGGSPVARRYGNPLEDPGGHGRRSAGYLDRAGRRRSGGHTGKGHPDSRIRARMAPGPRIALYGELRGRRNSKRGVSPSGPEAGLHAV